MDFGLAVEASVGIADKTRIIHSLSNELESFFKDRDYGSDVKKIVIGVICVAPEFEWFSKIRKPKYVEHCKYLRDGIEIEDDRIFSFDLKLAYSSVKEGSDVEILRILANGIVDSLLNLDSLPKRIKDFDKVMFKMDVLNYFTLSGLLD